MSVELATKNKEEKKKDRRSLKVVREIFAVILWLFILVKVVVFDIDIYLAEKYAPSLRWILNYRFFGLLLLISGTLLVIGKKSFRQFLIYVIAYPFIILFWQIPKLFFRNWALAIAFAPAIYEVISSFRSRFILITLASLSALFIVLSSSPYFLSPAMVFPGTYLIVYLYRNLRRAYRSSIFEGLADLVKKLRGQLERGEQALWKKVEHDPISEKGTKDYEQQLSTFYLLNWVVELIAEKLHMVAKSRKPDLYLMVSWLGTVFVTSLIYAFEYWALYKMNPLSFRAEYALTFWNFWGFSFGKLTPSSISSIGPVSSLAAILSYSELFCALIILVILVFSVLTAAREKYKDDIADFIVEIKSLGSEMQNQFFLLYNIALTDVEIILLRNNAALINWLRKKRGLPELPLPEKGDKNQGNTVLQKEKEDASI